MDEHDEPNCDPTVDCKFVGPRDCPCKCHRKHAVNQFRQESKY